MSFWCAHGELPRPPARGHQALHAHAPEILRRARPLKKDGGLAPKFIVVANLDAADGGEKIAAGSSRVLSARLNDARFFWDNDRKIKLEDRFAKLGNIVFHEKLGTVKDKAERVMALAEGTGWLDDTGPARKPNAPPSSRSATSSPTWSASFAELEGVMGRYYATLQGDRRLSRMPCVITTSQKGQGDPVPTVKLGSRRGTGRQARYTCWLLGH